MDHAAHDTLSELDRLQRRFDAIATRRDPHGRSAPLHAAILERLATNRRGAEATGWTGCALERDGGSGRLRLICLPPGEELRREVPDSA